MSSRPISCPRTSTRRPGRSRGGEPAPICGIVTDCDPIPLPDAAASVIVCSEVLEHVEAPARLLSELVRVGKPVVRYAISVPAASSEELMKVLAPPSYFEPPNHLRIFDRGDFEGLIRAAGLEIERSEALGYYWSIWWALRMASGTSHHPNLRHAPAADPGRLGSDLEGPGSRHRSAPGSSRSSTG